MYNPFAGVQVNWGYSSEHRGIDYNLSSGTNLVSAVTGTVTFAGLLGATVDGVYYENSWLKIREDGTNYVSVYMHMRNISVASGDNVVAGSTPLGQSGGAVGDWGKGQAGGAHVHWHLEIGANRANPLDYLSPGSNPSGGIENVRVIEASNGGLALIGEYSVTVYSAGEAFYYNANIHAWGKSAVSNDEFTTLVGEAQNRRASLIAAIAAAT